MTENPEHEKILNKMLEIERKAGVKCGYNWRLYGLNSQKSKEGIVLEVDYNVIVYVYTPEGYYVFGGGSWSGNAMDKFWELMKETFIMQEIKPKRDDSKVSGWEYQVQSSGPWIKLEWRTP